MATTTRRRPRTTSAKQSQSRSAPPDVGTLRQHYRLSQALLARLLDVSLRTVSGAEGGSITLPRIERNLTQVRRLCGSLADVMDPHHVGIWLDQPNDMMGGLKPVEAIERGQIDLVWQVVVGLQSGSQL
jgi:hypothetical protein